MSHSGYLSQTGSSDVVGPGTSTDRSVPTFNGTTGNLLRDNPLVTIAADGTLSLGSGQVINRTATATNYVVLSTDYYIGVTSTAAPRTITLPATPTTNKTYVVKDESGGSATNNITISVAGGVKTIDGATSLVINGNYDAYTFIYDGTNYFTF